MTIFLHPDRLYDRGFYFALQGFDKAGVAIVMLLFIAPVPFSALAIYPAVNFPVAEEDMRKRSCL